jgi:hypothetical protein
VAVLLWFKGKFDAKPMAYSGPLNLRNRNSRWRSMIGFPPTIANPRKQNSQIEFKSHIQDFLNFPNSFVSETLNLKFLLWPMASRRRMLLKVIILGDSG